MRISLNSAIILFLVICISAGVVLYPTGVSCTVRSHRIKDIEPFVEPNIRLGEPGDNPWGTMGTLGSVQGTSIDTQQPDLPNPDNRGNRAIRPRFTQLFFFYLMNFTSGPFQGW